MRILLICLMIALLAGCSGNTVSTPAPTYVADGIATPVKTLKPLPTAMPTATPCVDCIEGGGYKVAPHIVSIGSPSYDDFIELGYDSEFAAIYGGVPYTKNTVMPDKFSVWIKNLNDRFIKVSIRYFPTFEKDYYIIPNTEHLTEKAGLRLTDANGNEIMCSTTPYDFNPDWVRFHNLEELETNTYTDVTTNKEVTVTLMGVIVAPNSVKQVDVSFIDPSELPKNTNFPTAFSFIVEYIDITQTGHYRIEYNQIWQVFTGV